MSIFGKNLTMIKSTQAHVFMPWYTKIWCILICAALSMRCVFHDGHHKTTLVQCMKRFNLMEKFDHEQRRFVPMRVLNRPNGSKSLISSVIIYCCISYEGAWAGSCTKLHHWVWSWFPNIFQTMIYSAFSTNFLSVECHRTSLMISQH